MAKDTTFRWVRPLKAWEYYVERGLGGVSYRDGLQWLREHVAAGNIRVEFDGVAITPLIARLLLECFDLKFPGQSEEDPLPPDLYLNRPDIQRLLKQSETSAQKRPGRPKRAGSFAEADHRLVGKMNQMISSFGMESDYLRQHKEEMPWPTFKSPSSAAWHLVRSDEVRGAGNDEAKVRRLVKRYKEVFGDDG